MDIVDNSELYQTANSENMMHRLDRTERLMERLVEDRAANPVTTQRSSTAILGQGIQPKIFTPTMDIEIWLKRLEVFLDANAVTSNKKNMLMALLDDGCVKALEYIRLSENDTMAYEELKKALIEMYGKKELSTH